MVSSFILRQPTINLYKTIRQITAYGLHKYILVTNFYSTFLQKSLSNNSNQMLMCVTPNYMLKF